MRIVAALVWLAFVTAAAGETIDVHELKAHWQRYDGKIVTIHGQLDACNGGDCELCPETMTRYDQADLTGCVPLSFHAWADKSADVSEIDAASWRLYRYATVTVRADFHAMCFYDAAGKPVGPVVCTDGPANLNNALVLVLHGRKTSQTGLTDEDYTRPLAALPASDTADIAAEYARAAPDWALEFPYKFYAVVLTENERKFRRPNEGVDAIACACTADSCEGLWPNRYVERGMNGGGNPLHCWDMRKIAGGWRLVPEF